MSSNFLQALAGTHLYPITDQHLSRLSHAEQVVHLSNCGAPLIQLREKADHPLRFFEQAEAAVRVARDRGVRIIINDRVDIALALKADGVHLGQEDLPPEAARRILGNDAIIGFSTHSLEQASLAAKMPVDYVAIGPIFSTTTKQSANLPLGLEGLARVRKALGTVPLVAIGGITGENQGPVLQAGADVVAVISDIWLAAKDAANKTKHPLHIS
ncbi:MAG: thiamine phosphate synthase [Pyrinomonadaceae bacterium]